MSGFYNWLFNKNAGNDINSTNKTTQGNAEVNVDQTKTPDIQSEIVNVSGFDTLKITLSNTGTIYTRAECQMNLDNSLKIEAVVRGVVSGIFRSFSTGTFFLNKVFVDKEKGATTGSATLFSIVPGNILHLKIQPGEMWSVHHSAFLACSENITVETGISLNQTLTGNGTFYTRVSNTTQFAGNLWLTAYGGIIKRDLDKEGSNFRLHGGLFLATKQPVYAKMKIGLASTVFSAIAGGQWIMMDFADYVPTKTVVETPLANDNQDNNPVDNQDNNQVNNPVNNPVSKDNNATSASRDKKNGGSSSEVESDGVLYYQTGNFDEFMYLIADAVATKLPVSSASEEVFNVAYNEVYGGKPSRKNKNNRTHRIRSGKSKTQRKYVVKV